MPEQTADYHGSDPSGTPQGRVRMALAAGDGSIASDDIYRLLRRRLLVVSTVLAGFTLVVFGITQSRILAASAPLGFGPWLEQFFRQALPLAPGCVLIAILWRRPPRTIGGLRVVEWFAIGLPAAWLLRLTVAAPAWNVLESAADQPFESKTIHMLAYVNGNAVRWFGLLILYGSFIPNTWRRCAAVSAVLAASPLIAFLIKALWLQPLDPELIRTIVVNLGLWVAFGAIIAVLACSRLEILHRQAGEARTLGQYLLKEKLGAGGMGEVYRAEHVLLRRPCAIKLIRPDRAADPAALRRFEREVQATAALTHPNTVQIFDYGHAKDGTFYYVMEHLPGLTLEEVVRRDGPLPPVRVIHFLRQICASLGEAHGRGLIHRDVKPGNAMVCERGGVPDVVKLLDFGLVLTSASDPEGATTTRGGVVAGTPAFMSPEQAGGQDDIGPRSDLYSVGALAYFLLAGQPPFGERPTVKALAAHLYELPPALPESTPPPLSAIVMRCLAKAPSDRWEDAASLEAALASASGEKWTVDDGTAWWRKYGSA